MHPAVLSFLREQQAVRNAVRRIALAMGDLLHHRRRATSWRRL